MRVSRSITEYLRVNEGEETSDRKLMSREGINQNGGVNNQINHAERRKFT